MIDVQEDGVFINKKCPTHGMTRAMIERDPAYYMQCKTAGATNIYNGYFLDVTERCNLKCKYCYYGTCDSKDPSIDSLKAEAMITAHLAPIIISGGEPSIRKDLPEVITELKKIAPVELLTNGTGIDLDEILPLLTNDNGVVNINLSIHAESQGKDLNLIESISERGRKLESVLFVIDSVD